MSSAPPSGRTPSDLPPPTAPTPSRVTVAREPWGAPETRPGADHAVDLTLLDGIALPAWSLLGQVLIGAIVVGVAVVLGSEPVVFQEPPGSLVFTLAVMVGVLVGVFSWLAFRNRLSWRILGSRRPSPVHVLEGVGFAVLALVAALLVGVVGTWLTGSADDSGQALLESAALTGPSVWITILMVGVAAPIMEEVVFRGVLFQTIGRRIGWIPAMLLSSAVWAIIHVEVVLSGGNAAVFLLSLFALGCVFATAFNRTRSLVVPIVAHGLFNVTQIVLARSSELL